MRYLYKKIWPSLILPLALTLLLFLLSTSTAFAESFKPGDIGLDTLSSCGAWESFWGGLGPCLSYLAAQILFSVVQLASWLLWVVAKIFNIVLVVQNGAFHNQPLVNTGWIIARDVANIFYIFFLLIISIATIIRYDSYGMKQILWKLIVSALLVNFSLPITGLFIDFSNALGNTFYISMSTSEDTEATSFVKDSNGEIQTTLDISTTLISGFQPSKLLVRDPNTKKPTGPELADTLLNIVIAELFAIIMIVVVSVVLMAAMAMLITRIVVLWFVLILSPFAFLFWVLPRTSSLTSEWFETLFKHAFFYPAFMFTLYISITAINHGVIAKMVNADPDGLAEKMFASSAFASGGASFFTQKIQLILNFVILTMFMAGGLLVAQKMSIQGASAATSASKYLSGKGKSIGNRVQTRAGQGLNAVPAAISNKVLETRLGRIPLLRSVAAASVQKRAADRKAEAERSGKLVQDLTPRGQAMMLSSRSARGKASAYSKLNDKEKARVTQAMNADEQVQFARTIHDTDPDKDYDRQVAIASGSVEQAMKILHGKKKPEVGATAIEEKDYQDKVDKYVKGLNEKDLAKLRTDSINDVHFQRAAIKNNIDTEKLEDSRDIVDPNARDAFAKLTKEINGVTGAIRILHGVEKPADNALQSTKDEYQTFMDDYMASLPEKNIAKLTPAAAENDYFAKAFLKSAEPIDARRLASTAQGAATLQTIIERGAATNGSGKSYENLNNTERSANTNAFFNDLPNTNKHLDAWLKTTAGQGVILDGRRVSKRDIPMGPPSVAGGASASSTPPPPSPSPSP
ncbi:MAG: hypothetical protein EXS68_02095 [Candidatus Ryanbacteria bacterium]|nr:hypothetical protein [Candidatus Ryanbacteria bacterium]